MKRWFFLFPFILLFILTGCFHTKQPPPIYLIVIDTLRVDALSCYGGRRPTPGLDQFAAESVLFENCLAPSSWTVPSVASLMTGLYPFHHGTTKALQHAGRVVSQQVLSTGYTTMAEICQKNGYRTYGVSANGHIAREYGFAQGFDQYVEHSFTAKETVAAGWAGLAPRVTAEARFGQPTFVMLYYFDPHHPYAPQQPYIGEYEPNWHDKPVDLLTRDMVKLVQDDYFAKHPEMIDLARALYDSEVAALDAHLAKLLPSLPGYDKAWIILTSDHGESFGEEGKMLHGNNLRQTEAHIPLLIKMPQKQLAGTRISQPVSLVDLLPTVVEILGLPQPPSGDGVSLLPLLRPNPPEQARRLFAHIDLPWARQRAMLSWPYKIIAEIEGDQFLYDLTSDPREERNLAQERQAELARLYKELTAGSREEVRFPARVKSEGIPPEIKEKLRSLGYLSR